MKHNLVNFALIFSLGIYVASLVTFPSLIILALAWVLLFLACLSLRKDLSFQLCLCALAFLAGAAALKNSAELSRCDISRAVYYQQKDSLYQIKGFIYSEPVLKNNRLEFIFSTEAVLTQQSQYLCCGKALVYLKGVADLHYGDALVLWGNLRRVFSYPAGRQFSYRDYLRQQGVYVIIGVKSENFIRKLNQNKGLKLKRFALWLKEKIREIISRNTSGVSAAMLNAMILGDRTNLPFLINNAMIKSGTVHILVVSGFNVGIVAFLVILCLKLARIPRRLRFCLALPLLIIYCLLTGASTPVVRATVMAIIFILAYLFKKEADIYNSCALAALFILWANPRQLFDPGFQLSFASVISIIYFYPKIKMFLRAGDLKSRYLRFLADNCLVSFSAWLGTCGFVAFYFKIFAPVTVIANLMIVPLAALITLCGFSLIFIALAFPALAAFFAAPCELLAALLLNINASLIRLPAAYFYLF